MPNVNAGQMSDSLRKLTFKWVWNGNEMGCKDHDPQQHHFISNCLLGERNLLLSNWHKMLYFFVFVFNFIFVRFALEKVSDPETHKQVKSPSRPDFPPHHFPDPATAPAPAPLSCRQLAMLKQMRSL